MASNSQMAFLMLKMLFAILLVVVGSEWVVDSAVALALLLGISSAVVGLTFLSIGTSIPEMATSATAALSGHGGVSVGNIIGSDLVQITLLVGICAFIRPIFLKKSDVRRDGPILVVAILLGLAAMITGHCSEKISCVGVTSSMTCNSPGNDYFIFANSINSNDQAPNKIEFVFSRIEEDNSTLLCESDNYIHNRVFKRYDSCQQVHTPQKEWVLLCNGDSFKYSLSSKNMIINIENEEELVFSCEGDVTQGKKSTSCVTRSEGIVLILLYAAYVFYLIFKRKNDDASEELPQMGKYRAILMLIAGFIFVVAGSNLLVTSAVDLAVILSVPAFVIGLTLVAFGTSLPELIISAMAAYRGQEEMSMGNLVGSNITDPLLSLGFGVAVGGNVIVSPHLVYTHGVYMLACTTIALMLMWKFEKIERKAAILLAALYLVYMPLFAI